MDWRTAGMSVKIRHPIYTRRADRHQRLSSQGILVPVGASFMSFAMHPNHEISFCTVFDGDFAIRRWMMTTCMVKMSNVSKSGIPNPYDRTLWTFHVELRRHALPSVPFATLWWDLAGKLTNLDQKKTSREKEEVLARVGKQSGWRNPEGRKRARLCVCVFQGHVMSFPLARIKWSEEEITLSQKDKHTVCKKNLVFACQVWDSWQVANIHSLIPLQLSKKKK